MHRLTWQTPSWQTRCRSSQSAGEEQFRAHFVSDLPQPPAIPHSTQTFFNVYPASQPSEELALVPQSVTKNPAASTKIQRIDMGTSRPHRVQARRGDDILLRHAAQRKRLGFAVKRMIHPSRSRAHTTSKGKNDLQHTRLT